MKRSNSYILMALALGAVSPLALGQDTKAPRAGSASGQAQTERKAQAADTHFLQALNAINQSEIRLAETAQDRLNDDELKGFADMMSRDHRQAQEAVRKAANRFKVELEPKELAADIRKLREEGDKMLEGVTKADKAGFDDLFLRHAVRGHDRALQLIRQERGRLTLPHLKDLADALTFDLQKHRKLAQSLQSRARLAE